MNSTCSDPCMILVDDWLEGLTSEDSDLWTSSDPPKTSPSHDSDSGMSGMGSPVGSAPEDGPYPDLMSLSFGDVFDHSDDKDMFEHLLGGAPSPTDSDSVQDDVAPSPRTDSESLADDVSMSLSEHEMDLIGASDHAPITIESSADNETDNDCAIPIDTDVSDNTSVDVATCTVNCDEISEPITTKKTNVRLIARKVLPPTTETRNDVKYVTLAPILNVNAPEQITCYRDKKIMRLDLVKVHINKAPINAKSAVINRVSATSDLEKLEKTVCANKRVDPALQLKMKQMETKTIEECNEALKQKTNKMGSKKIEEYKVAMVRDHGEKNAIMAKINRQKKKEYIKLLEDTISDLKKENITMKDENQRFAAEKKVNEEELCYLKNVLANQSTLSSLLQNIGNTKGVHLSTSFSSRKRSIESDHDYLEPNKKSRAGGVCLHVDNNNVSLEFCSKCAGMACTDTREVS